MSNYTVHFDNGHKYDDPAIYLWDFDGSGTRDKYYPLAEDTYGPVFRFSTSDNNFTFKFVDGSSPEGWEKDNLNRHYTNHINGNELWCKANTHEIYTEIPAMPVGDITDFYASVKDLLPENNIYLPDTCVGGRKITSLLGATVLKDGSILFGFFHPKAQRVYLTGNFNNWAYPNHGNSKDFIEMKLYLGYYDVPNLWLTRITPQEIPPIDCVYKFHVQGGLGGGERERTTQDPYSRKFENQTNNSAVVDPTTFIWSDHNWQTLPIDQLIIYELNVYGFTEGDTDIPIEMQGKFKGVTKRISDGYFEKLGVTALYFMPLSERPSPEGPDSLGYDPVSFFSMEIDFGDHDDFRELVNTAHNHGLAILVDQVFNHTSSSFNILWNLIEDGSRGGLYFDTQDSPWGNRLATNIEEVQNMCIDSCKLLIKEYHVDGFRFDATNSQWLNHRLLYRLAEEIKENGFKSDAILIAENLPPETDLNRSGFNGYSQWSDPFHDKIKALLREGTFEGQDYTTKELGSIFYFSKDEFALHTNNTVNYCESHDENSVQFELKTYSPVDGLKNPLAYDRKGRLGLFAAMVAMGQPMIYMGQEFGTVRAGKHVSFDWPKDLENNPFFAFAHRLINLRKRYPALKLFGFNPAEQGTFQWLAAPWLTSVKGGGKKVIGWLSRPNEHAHDTMVILMNFENSPVVIDISFQLPGKWVKLADIDQVNDIFPYGNNSIHDITSIETRDGNFSGFELKSSSAYIYKWDSGL